MTYKALKLLAEIGICIIFVVAVLLLAGCGGNGDRQTASPPSGVEQELKQFSLARSQKGQIKWKLDSKAAVFLDINQVKIEDVKLVIFGNKSDETVRIHSDRGVVNRGTNDVMLTGNVVGTFSGGGRLTTDEIYWRESEKKIYTMPGKRVTIYYKDSIIIGEELDARPELETVALKNVKGVTKVAKDEG